MMKRLYLCVYFIVLLTIIEGKCYRNNEIKSISSGTSFGFCRSYCRQSINITSKPAELIASKEPNYAQDAYPTLQKIFSFSSNEWKQLIDLVDSKGFQSLDDRIGCPDCADGGAEWIEINWSHSNKQVTFEYGQLIKGFEGFINQLRTLREQYIDQL